MTCPVCDYDYLSEIQCDHCFLPQSHFEYARDILWGVESVALHAVREKFKKISIEKGEHWISFLTRLFIIFYKLI